MTPHCDAVRSHLAASMGGEATPLGAEAIARHLEICESCAAAVARLRSGREVADGAHPRAPAPGSLARALRRQVRRETTGLRWIAASAAALLLAAGAPALLASHRQRGDLEALAGAAVGHHDDFALARSRLDLPTSDPTRLVAWFASAVPFPIRLPALDSPDLSLLGGTRTAVAGELAGYVAYRKGSSLVSLAVMPVGASAPPRGAESEAFGSLQFHLSRMRGHNVITWADRGLGYALVSDLPARGRASCSVCHAPGSGLRDVEGFHR